MPRSKSTHLKKRLNLDLPEESFTTLNKVMALSFAESYTEVIRRSIALYQYLWETKKEGPSIVVREKDGKEKEIGTF